MPEARWVFRQDRSTSVTVGCEKHLKPSHSDAGTDGGWKKGVTRWYILLLNNAIYTHTCFHSSHAFSLGTVNTHVSRRSHALLRPSLRHMGPFQMVNCPFITSTTPPSRRTSEIEPLSPIWTSRKISLFLPISTPWTISYLSFLPACLLSSER